MLLLLILLFNSVCLRALSDTQCVLPLLITRGNSSNSGDCQTAGACDDSEPTYIGRVGQSENLHESISECNFSIHVSEGELHCNASNDQLYIEMDSVSDICILQPGSCRLNFCWKGNLLQHSLVFRLNGTPEVCSDNSGSGSGKTPFCPAVLMSKSALALLKTMTTPTGTQGSPTGDSNTGSEMGSGDHLYIALGGGIVGGILSLVILLLLVIVCCLATKMIRNERQMQLKLSNEAQPVKAVDNSTYSGEGQTNDFEQTKLSSTDQMEDMYETVDDERTNADKQSTSLSHASSHGSEAMSGNYTYVSSHSCKKRPTIREATCSLRTTAEFGEYSEITEEQQTSQLYQSIGRPKMVQPNSQPSPDHPTTPHVAKLPATNDEYSHLQHTKFTNGAPERFSMPLPPPSEEYSRLDVRSRTFKARHSDYSSIELSSFHSDSQPQTTSQQVENEYSVLEEALLPSQDDSPPLPPPFHPELSRQESNNEVGIYAELDSAQDVELGEGNYSCLYDEAMPDKEALYDDIPTLEV